MFADTLILRWSRSRRRRSWCGQPRVHALPAQPAVPDARALRAQRARRRPRGLCRTRSVQRWDPWAPAAMRGADREEPGAERRGGTRATRSRPGALAAVQSSGSSLPDLSVAVASPSRSFREAQTREGSWSPSRRENGSIRPSLPRPCRSLAARSSAARAHPSVRRALECGHTRRGLTVRPCGAEIQSSPPAEGSAGGSAARALPAWRPACPHRAVGCALSDPGTPRERSAAKSFSTRQTLELVAIFTGESPVRTSEMCSCESCLGRQHRADRGTSSGTQRRIRP